MKLFHLSDLHIGLKINGFSMLEDQQYILDEILELADREKPDAVIIAGDVYDKTIPPSEAVSVFDDFLYELSCRDIKAFVISGNHDSAERLAFGGRIMTGGGIYISPVFEGAVSPVTLEDKYGEINFYLLPFVKPSHVRACFPDEEIQSYTDGVRVAVEHMNINTEKRNVIVAHQFFVGTDRPEPDSDMVDCSVLAPFDYGALGHIHSSKGVGCDVLRYCGTPIKYSFSECGNKNSVTVVEMREKGNTEISRIELKPRHDWREIKGTYMELTSKRFYDNFSTEDYMHVILTDEEDIPDAVSKLRVIYPNIMHLSYDNRRTQAGFETMPECSGEQKTPLELFEEFYQLQNNQPLSDLQREFVKDVMRDIWEAEL